MNENIKLALVELAVKTNYPIVTFADVKTALKESDRIDRYKEWIVSNYPDKESSNCKCYEATERMLSAFPELISKAGIAYSVFTSTPHRWLETKYGILIDPTEAQFTGSVQYVIPEEGEEIETGKHCMECGNDIYILWNDSYQDIKNKIIVPTFCCKHCEDRFIAYQDGSLSEEAYKNSLPASIT